MALIADEVFLDFPREKNRSALPQHASADFCDERTLKIAGLPQMKMAWLSPRSRRVKKNSSGKVGSHRHTYLSPNAPVQLATPVFLEQRGGFRSKLCRA